MASVTDGLGAGGSDQISVTVNGPPVVAVTAPADGTTATEGTGSFWAGCVAPPACPWRGYFGPIAAGPPKHTAFVTTWR